METKPEKLFRVTCDGQGIYAAIEQYCPAGDSRRQNKPDGSWLAKVGGQFPGAISFWRGPGLKLYRESGLLNWHASVVQGKMRMVQIDFPEQVLYQDELQVICLPEAVLWDKEYAMDYCGPKPYVSLMTDKRPDCIRHHQSLRDWIAYSGYTGSDETFTCVASIGKDLGLKALGLHHEILLPGKRSSWPHAHKIEEEFVYVLKGQPDLWLNGKLYLAREGELLFFPPDTNLAHTMLNNTAQPVEFIVIGEQQIQNEKVFYPCHPLRNQECRHLNLYWEDHPHVVSGGNSGVAGDLSHRADAPYVFQRHFSQIRPKTTERDLQVKERILIHDRDLGRALGAKRVAVHHLTIPAGFRSGYPHAEMLEEEFVYLLSGQLTAWLDGHHYPLQPGDSVALPAGTGVAHTFINHGPGDAQLLVMGETWKKGNRYFCPLDPQLKSKAPEMWWDDCPKRVLGPDSALPS